MASKTFEDSSGAVWEVFEVHRTSQKPGAVSAGMEMGWLAFVSGGVKRRLAPFPSDWDTISLSELERLCASARQARSQTVSLDGQQRPGIRRSITGRPAPLPQPTERPVGELARSPRATPSTGLLSIKGEGSPVEQRVRSFAHEARVANLPAIEAMVRLKAQLLTLFPAADSEARDMRSVRRWFVEAYYFEREL